MSPGPGSRSSKLTRWIPAIAWMGVIFRLSSLPGSSVPGRFSGVGHFVTYAMLGALVYSAERRSGSGHAAAGAIIVASLYGVTDEFHQYFVPGRTPDVADWAVDTLGAASASLGLLLVSRLRASRGRGRRDVRE